MSDWRSYAQRREWRSIEIVGMTDDERSELIEILNSALPKTERGHGLQTFHGAIAPRHACSIEEAEGAVLLEGLMRKKESLWGFDNDPFGESYDFAVNYAKRCGLNYEGWSETYLYWGESGWVQVSSADAKQIIAVREVRLAELDDLPREQAIEAFRALELDCDAWQNVRPISLLFRLDSFEPYTPLWHALNMLNFIDSYREDLRPEIEFGTDGDKRLSADLIAHTALAVGRSWQALLGKPAEKHAFRGMKVIKGASDGGNGRRDTLAPDTSARLAKMEHLVPTLGVKGAAEALYRKGIGASAGANRGLWYRHLKK